MEIIDNKPRSNSNNNEASQNKSSDTVFEFIKSEFNKVDKNGGELKVVTGYFTVEAIDKIYSDFNNKIRECKILIGDNASSEIKQERIIDLLSDECLSDDVVNFPKSVKNATQFFKRKEVEVQTVEPNFCHAKLMLLSSPSRYFYLTGSSNLTKAGLGITVANNVELNVAGASDRGSDNDFKAFDHWFDELWESQTKKISNYKSDTNARNEYKEKLIKKINEYYIKRTPEDIYYKMVYEFDIRNKEAYMQEIREQTKHLYSSTIYYKLYEFQKNAVQGLIYNLEKYNGAILADSVGLGKTWTALAVMLHYQYKKRRVLMLCPKKLEQNWNGFLKGRDSVLENDNFNYYVRFHTDLSEERMSSYNDIKDTNFIQRPLLIVIDESHNLRNDNSARYKYLLEHIIQANKTNDVKVLMLSATPINNSFNDLRNQIKLFPSNNAYDVGKAMVGRSIEEVFKQVNKEFHRLAKNANAENDRAGLLKNLMNKLPQDYNELTKNLVIGRTRKIIKESYPNVIHFPKTNKPKSIRITQLETGKYKTLDDIVDNLPNYFAVYKPTHYTKEYDNPNSILTDEKQRDMSLVKMMYIMMIKRYESSWCAFQKTVEKIYDHYDNVLKKVNSFIAGKNGTGEANDDTIEGQNLAVFGTDVEEIENLAIGKRDIKLKSIDESGMLINFKEHITDDFKKLKELNEYFSEIDKKMNNKNSKSIDKCDDKKLEKLMQELIKKQKKENKKMLIFTAYKDTAEYLYDQLTKRGFSDIGLVTGSSFKSDKTIIEGLPQVFAFKKIISCFSPKSKVYNDNTWDREFKSYEEWKEYIDNNYEIDPLCEYAKEIIDNEIDILIATDVLSEGQNLQDADTVVNYDIHWNPIRLTQRQGRIDRIGSENESVNSICFFPDKSIDAYLNLSEKVEKKVIMGVTAGQESANYSAELNEVIEKFNNKNKDQKDSENLQRLKAIAEEKAKIEAEYDDYNSTIAKNERIDDFNAKVNTNYENIPNGVFSGVYATDEAFDKEGLVALLAYPKAKTANDKYTDFKLVYLDLEGKLLSDKNDEVFTLMRRIKNSNRAGLEKIDNPKNTEEIEQELKKLKNAIDAYGDFMKRKVQDAEEDARRLGKKISEEKIKEKSSIQNYDLITWMKISKNN